jgi:VanZ family protein
MLQWKIFRSKWTAMGWLILISFLFFLPGSALPRENWFAQIYIDKWVHVGLFAALVFLWRSAFGWRPGMLVLFSLAYGFSVEMIQQQWIPNRSFDWFDVLADMTGTVLGLLVWTGAYRKNKPL